MKLHDGKIYTQYDSDLWSGDIPLPAEVKAPVMSWKGGRINQEEWRKIVSFLLWTNTEFKSEGLIQLFYNEERGIFGYPPPQTVGTGMTIAQRSTKEDWDAYDAIHRVHIGDAEPIGSVHHHCSAGAFQSSVDKEDETKKVGLHITLGNMDKPTLAFHSRLSFRKNFYEPNLFEWFELPEWMNNVTKMSILKELVIDMICQVPEDLSFPELWKETCWTKPAVVVTNTYESWSKSKGQYSAFDNDPWSKFYDQADTFDASEMCYAYEAKVKTIIQNMPSIVFKEQIHNDEHLEIITSSLHTLDVLSYRTEPEVYMETITEAFEQVLDQVIDIYSMFVKAGGKFSETSRQWGDYIEKAIEEVSVFDPVSASVWCERSEINDRFMIERLAKKLSAYLQRDEAIILEAP